MIWRRVFTWVGVIFGVLVGGSLLLRALVLHAGVADDSVTFGIIAALWGLASGGIVFAFEPFRTLDKKGAGHEHPPE